MKKHDKAFFCQGFVGADVNIHIGDRAYPVPAPAAFSVPSGPCAPVPNSIIGQPSTFGFMLTSRLASRITLALDSSQQPAPRQPSAQRENKVVGVNRVVLRRRTTTSPPTTANAQAVA